MITTRPLSPYANPQKYVRWDNLSLDDLRAQANQLACSDTCELRANDGGLSCQGDGPELPLPLSDLREALDQIEQRQEWLTDRPGVSIYEDRKGAVHVDVVNFGGFILADGGKIASSSVNAW